MLKKLFTIGIICISCSGTAADHKGGLSNPNNFLLFQREKHEVTVLMSDLVGILPDTKFEKQPGGYRFWSETRGKNRKFFMVYFAPRSVVMLGPIQGTVSGLGKPLNFTEQGSFSQSGAFVAELSEQAVKAFSGESKSVFMTGHGLSVNFTVDGNLIGQVLK